MANYKGSILVLPRGRLDAIKSEILLIALLIVRHRIGLHGHLGLHRGNGIERIGDGLLGLLGAAGGEMTALSAEGAIGCLKEGAFILRVLLCFTAQNGLTLATHLDRF